MNILFQYSTYNGKETPFRSEMDKTTSRKQTRSSYVSKEIKTLVIFRMLFAYMSLESIRTHESSRVNYSCTEFSFGVLVPKNKCLRPRGLIWKREQHTFGTFGQVNKNCPFSRVRNAFIG